MKNKSDMAFEQELDILENIHQIEVSPFLYTRIETKIEDYKNSRIDKKTLVLSFSFIGIICLVNFIVLANFISEKNRSKKDAIIETFHLSSSNSLYHE